MLFSMAKPPFDINSGYSIDQSALFDSDDDSYLSTTVGAGGDPTDLTVSTWVKRSELGLTQYLVYTRKDATNIAGLMFDGSDRLRYYNNIGGSFTVNKISTPVFRDVTGWYNVLLYINTDNSTAEDRFQIRVNGVRITDWDTNTNTHTQSAGQYIGGPWTHKIGKANVSDQFNGYMSDFHFVYGGTAPDVDQFGEFDGNGVWQPIEYTGSYGTNGSHFDFADSSNFGNDVSGNNNDWTDNNFATNHQVSDTPTINYSTLSAIDKVPSRPIPTSTIVDGALQVTGTATTDGIRSTIYFNSGKVVCELTAISGITYSIGVATDPANNNMHSIGAYYYVRTGAIVKDAVLQSTEESGATNDRIRVEVDYDGDSIEFFRNDVSQATVSYTFTGPICFEVSLPDLWYSVVNVNFGQRSWTDTPTAGFVGLSTENIPTPDVLDGEDYFNTILYTGNGSTQSITGVGFQPDLVWIKDRNNPTSHVLMDSTRGTSGALFSNDNYVEDVVTDAVTSFDSDGFSVGDGTELAYGTINTNTRTYVAWCWKEGVTPGFDIVSYTGTGSAHTENHSLGTIPDVIIAKSKDSANHWGVYHSSKGATVAGLLNLTNTFSSSNYWNSTEPTSTVFSVGVDDVTNKSGDNFIAYLFTEVEGFSKIGSYTGNGSTGGPFVWCGFRPAYLLIKNADTTMNWMIHDTIRNTYNPLNKYINADSFSSEATSGQEPMDITSNGFKIRASDNAWNGSGHSMIFLAFAENPFTTARAR